MHHVAVQDSTTKTVGVTVLALVIVVLWNRNALLDNILQEGVQLEGKTLMIHLALVAPQENTHPQQL